MCHLFNLALSFLSTPGHARPLVRRQRPTHRPLAPGPDLTPSHTWHDDAHRLYARLANAQYRLYYDRRGWRRQLVAKEDGTVRTVVYMTSPANRHRQSPVRSKGFHQRYLARRPARLPHLLPGYPFLALGEVLEFSEPPLHQGDWYLRYV